MGSKKVIVCGSKFGQFYVEALARMENEYELVGILGKGSVRTRACAVKYNINLYTDLDEIPSDVEIAYVIVRTGVMGGEGSELALNLMEKGIHVLQEQPVHISDLKKCIKKSNEKGVVFGISNIYYHMSSIREFIRCVESKIHKEDILAIEMACSNQVTFTAIDILINLFKEIPVITFDDQRLDDGQFVTITGKIADKPLTIKIYNIIDPDDPDNYCYYLQQVHIYTAEGMLSLTDVNGPIIWKPQFSVAHDFFIKRETEKQSNLANKNSYFFPCKSQDRYEDLFDREWVDAVCGSIKSFDKLIDGYHFGNARGYIQRLVLVATIWNRITQKTGYPKLLHHDRHCFQNSENVIHYLSKKNMFNDHKQTQDVKGKDFVLPDEITYSYTKMAKKIMNKACLDSVYFNLCRCWDITESGIVCFIDELISKLRVKKENCRILLRWMKELNNNGYVSYDNPEIIFLKTITAEEVKGDWEKVKEIWVEKLSNDNVIHYYLKHIERISELLSGELDAMLLLFPEGEIDLANKFYRENLMERYLAYNISSLVREYVTNSIQNQVEILEIGAGTGATTDKVLVGLDDLSRKVNYIYSDISMYFLNYAKDKYRNYSFIEYQMIDIKKKICSQGIKSESADIIIAAGMLNNAINTGEVLKQLADVLKPGGIMLIAEPVGENYELMLSQAFLMDIPTDERKDDNTTFLGLEQWKRILYGCGITKNNLYVLPEKNHPLDPLNQKLFVAAKSKDEE